MEGPRGTKSQEIQKVIDLTDQVFRISAGLAPTMGQEFPLLLNDKNKERMRVMVEENQPIAVVNYYKSSFLIQGTPIPIGSVGAVCTHPEHQGRGLATVLLDDVENQMRQEDIFLMLVSGRLNIYRRRSCSVSGDFYKVSLLPSEKREKVNIIPYESKDIDLMIQLYQLESLRYERTYDEFTGFLEGGTTPWGNNEYEVYLVQEQEETYGYFILRLVRKGEEAWGDIREYAGDRRKILEGVYATINQHGLSHIDISFPSQDPIKSLIISEGIEIQKENQIGTLKILQFTKLMDQLKPYFSSLVSENLLNQLEYYEKQGRYGLAIGKEKLEFTTLDELNQFIFGTAHEELSYSWDMQDKPLLQQFYNAVFPVPIPWAGGLNFI